MSGRDPFGLFEPTDAWDWLIAGAAVGLAVLILWGAS